ncbi:MAG: molybdenum ABC transporter ATP-binding protein [Rhodospirillales bacterium]|nr:molybdenum ABC transporter ATP-binding protein [Rhodospirillales bacterium]
MLDVAVRQRLGNFVVDVAFQGPAAGVTALFGPSGSGKSTIISAIAGLRRPDAGHVRLGDVTFFDAAAGINQPLHRRRVGWVFQDARLFPHMSVRHNLLYGFRRAPAAECRIGFDQVVALLGIEPLLSRLPYALSGGEKQRVALGRALLSQPRLLLMDEPLASLDAGRKAEILPYIEKLRDEVRLPIVWVSHVLDEVARLADTLVILEHGRAVACGDITTLLARLDLFPPDSPYEAGALLTVRVAGHDNGFALTRLAFDGGELLVPRLAQPVGERLRIRIRARDVMLAGSEPPDLSALNVLSAVVEEVRMADAAHADIRLSIGKAQLVSRITRRSAERLNLAAGGRIFAVVKSVAIDGRRADPLPSTDVDIRPK